MATPPTFVASYGNTAFASGTQTASVTVTAGDLIVVAAGTYSPTATVATPTGGGLTYTLQQSVVGLTQQANTYVWTAQSPTSQTFTLSLTATGSAAAWFAEVWRNHGGVGASAKKTATATTSLTLTPQGANSALFMVNNDYNGLDGSTRTYLTSVGAFTEKEYQFSGVGSDGSVETMYGGHHADSGAVASKTVGMSAPTGQRPSLIVLEVLAAPVVATGSLSITATALPTNVPPAVRIDVNDTRSPGQASSLTIVRNDPDGTQSPVRTFDGNPLVLSGGIGLVYDYEMPLGEAVSYTSIEVAGVTSLQATVSSSQAWLVHPGVPSLSVSVRHFKPGSFTKRTAPVVRGVFRPMGRANAVIITDGARKGYESSFSILTTTDDERAAVEALTADASPLLLNIPAGLGYNFSSQYVSLGDIDYAPVVDKMVEDWFTVTLPFTVVDRPAGGSQSSRTFADLLAEFGSLAAIQSAYRTLADVLAGP